MSSEFVTKERILIFFLYMTSINISRDNTNSLIDYDNLLGEVFFHTHLHFQLKSCNRAHGPYV